MLRKGLCRSREPPRGPHTRSWCAPNFAQDNTTPTVPARLNFRSVTHTRKSQTYRNRTHDHDIERHEDPALRPVRLGIRHDIVDEGARLNLVAQASPLGEEEAFTEE